MALIEIAEVLVDAEEFAESSERFGAFAHDANAARKAGKLGDEAFSFEGGAVKARSLPLGVSEAIDLPAEPAPGEVPFQPIGIGRPLGIEIQYVYAGDLPRSLIQRTPDLLITSAARSWAVTGAAPRALNRLAKDVERRQTIDFPAPETGSRLAFYSKAMTQDSTSVTVEMVADSFPKEAFEQISGLLGKASGLPVFASASLYLLAGSIVAKALGGLGERLVDGKAFFTDTLDVLFSTAGMEAAQPRKAVLLNRGTEQEFRGKYVFAPGSYELISTVDKSPYLGPVPYVCVSIDGQEKKSYEGFAASALSTALLDRFFHLDSGGDEIAQTLYTALELYNDVEFARKAGDAKAQRDTYEEGSEGYKKAQRLLDAFLKNIKNDDIRKGAGG
jgi:hypothetical protein